MLYLIAIGIPYLVFTYSIVFVEVAKQQSAHLVRAEKVRKGFAKNFFNRKNLTA